MRTSRSIASSSRWLVAAAALLLLLVLAPGLAEARRRLVVLEFTGPKAADFQADVEKMLKKSNSVVPTKKWDAAAEKLGATKVNEKNVKKVAKKLSIDGVIVGRVEKRGSRYILHLQLREGRSGKTVAAPDIVERDEGLSVDGRDTIKQELLPIIDDLPPAGGDEDEDEGDDDADEDEDDDRGGRSGFGKGKARGGDDEDEDEGDDEDDEDEDVKPKGKGKGKGKVADKGKGKGKGKGKASDDDEDEGDDEDDEDEDVRPKGKGKGKVADKGKGKGKGKASDDDEDEGDDEGDDDDGGDDDDRVAARGGDDDDGGGDDDDEGGDDDGDDEDDDISVGGKVNLSNPRKRAADVSVGLSFTGRKLSFTTNLMMNRPQGYDGGPVPGIRIGADVFPLAFNARNKGFKRNLGLSFLYDRVLSISSNLEKMGTTYELPTTEHHFAAGVLYRHPIGKALQVEGSVRFNKRIFRIDRNNPELNPEDIDIPNTNYTYVDPGVAVKYMMGPKMVLGGGARFLLITDTGSMQDPTQYGGATVTGIDVQAGLDYQFGPKMLVRGVAQLTTIGYAFAGNGALTNNRDGDATDTDVSGARDTYFGGFASGVYLF